MGTLVFIISVFLFNTIPGYAVATVFLAAVIKISKVPVKFIFKGLKAIFIILIITMVFNVFLTPGEVLWSFGFLKATREGISLAGKMAKMCIRDSISTVREVLLPQVWQFTTP